MKQLGCSESTVRRHVHALITEGYLLEDGYFGHTKCYRLNLDKLPLAGRKILEKAEAPKPVATNGHKPADDQRLEQAHEDYWREQRQRLLDTIASCEFRLETETDHKRIAILQGNLDRARNRLPEVEEHLEPAIR